MRETIDLCVAVLAHSEDGGKTAEQEARRGAEARVMAAWIMDLGLDPPEADRPSSAVDAELKARYRLHFALL